MVVPAAAYRREAIALHEGARCLCSHHLQVPRKFLVMVSKAPRKAEAAERRQLRVKGQNLDAATQSETNDEATFSAPQNEPLLN